MARKALVVEDEDSIRFIVARALEGSGWDVVDVSDGSEVYIAGVMEHIEEAGIHSGDSACALPPHSLPSAILEEIEEQTRQLALGLRHAGFEGLSLEEPLSIL